MTIINNYFTYNIFTRMSLCSTIQPLKSTDLQSWRIGSMLEMLKRHFTSTCTEMSSVLNIHTVVHWTIIFLFFASLCSFFLHCLQSFGVVRWVAGSRDSDQNAAGNVLRNSASLHIRAFCIKMFFFFFYSLLVWKVPKSSNFGTKFYVFQRHHMGS